jgi:uroporphyrinogen decarboxylase
MAEPVAGLLSPSLEEEFAAPYVKEIIDAVQADDFAVIYHNCGDNTPLMIPSLISLGAAAYHFGNSIDLRVMLDAFPKDVPVMGNVDPAGVLRQGTPDGVRAETLRIMSECSAYPNFVISSGCDIPPATPWENIEAFFAAVEEYYGNASLLCER